MQMTLPFRGMATQAEKGFLPALRFERLTPLFDPVVRLTSREGEFKRRLLAQAGISPGMTVLDLGCGTGTLAIDVKRAEPAAEVIGLDADPAILERARGKVDKAGLDIALDHGFADDLPYEDGSFDRVISTLFFHHLPPAVKAGTASEITRVLKHGGELHVADWTNPRDPLMRLGALGLRLFDGDEPTRDNLAGRLPDILAAGGLADVRERDTLRLAFGLLALLSGRRP